MNELITGKLEIKNSNGSGTAIILNGDALPQSGFAKTGKPILTKKGRGPVSTASSFLTGQLDIKDDKGKVVMSLGVSEIEFANQTLRAGSLNLLSTLTGESQLNLSGNGSIVVGGAGILHLKNGDETRMVLEANERALTIHSPRDLRLIKLDAENGVITNGLMKLMANGDIEIPRSLRLDSGKLRIGAEPNGQGGDGSLRIRNSQGQTVFLLNSADGTLNVGSSGGKDGMILVRNGAGKETVRLDGKAGDIILQNADCAEEFDVAGEETAEPGTVMVLDENGRLRVSEAAYDNKVAGVVSGAGDYKPGIILDRQPGDLSRSAIALMGKVFCKVDARHSPIVVGDLLTTSPTPGHAMKAADPMQAFGAVLGKALRPLTEGSGLIPVLVSLQ